MKIGIYHLQDPRGAVAGFSLHQCNDNEVGIVMNTKRTKTADGPDWTIGWRFTFYHELSHDILNLDHLWEGPHNLLGTTEYPKFWEDSAYRESLLVNTWTNPDHPRICSF